MKVAIFGCLHGMVDEMFNAVERYENETSTMIDLVLVCGDCQTIRHQDDLSCLAVPNKYKQIGDFHNYYSGIKKIPRLTIFVGGNHEASNYLMALPYGGWVCDNFYYLGYAGVVRYKGLRIAGVSGIYKYHDCNKGRFERMPLNADTVRSVYHTRRLDIFRLQLLSENANRNNPIDVFMSHDWPAKIYDFGNKQQLLQYKPFFKEDIERRDGLGNPMTRPLVDQLKPRQWFAAHLHCRFYAKVTHQKPADRVTEFLSLNKIKVDNNPKNNKRNQNSYMDVQEIEPEKKIDDSEDDLLYDPEWLTILRKTISLENDSDRNVFCPRIDDQAGEAYLPKDEEIEETIELMNASGDLKIQRNFKMTEPVIYNRTDGSQPSVDPQRRQFHPNPQTEELCSRLKLDSCKAQADQSTKVRFEGEACEETSTPRGSRPGNATKKLALARAGRPIELDEDGCLPFFIDTQGSK